MQWMNELGRRMRMLLRREEFDRDLEDEMRLHMELRAAEQAERGVPAEDARAAARRQFGNTMLLREQSRDAWGWRWLVDLWQDVRYGVRNLRRTPGFTAVTVLTLALGMGATTAIFSAVNPILFEPLPYPNPHRIAMIWDFGSEGAPLDVTFGTYRELDQRSRSFEALAVLKPWQPTITSASQPERLNGQRVSASYFRALGVLPMMGRDFETSEDRLGGPNVVVLSTSLWQRRFGGEATLIGCQIRLDDDLYTVVGVTPSAFENVLDPSAELWAPLQYDTVLRPQSREWGHHLRMVGRLRDGVTTEQARWEIDTIAHNPLPELPRMPWASLEQGLIVTPLQGDVTRGIRPALLAFLGAVLLVLLIACVNVTNLLLARSAQRRGEFAVRAALGAGPLRLIQQVLTESLLLAVLGGALGMVVAVFGVSALIALSPAGLPRVNAIGLDGAVFAFALGITTLTGLAVGLIPALQASRSDPRDGLQQISRSTAGGHQLTRRTLVVVEVALALVLLVSAGLLLRSLERLFSVDVGFRAANLFTMQVQESGHRYEADGEKDRFFVRALEAVERVPGVREAAFTSQLPLSGDLDGYGVTFENEFNPADDHSVFRYAVSPSYFQTMGIPLRSGRLLDERDAAGKGMVVVISESLAKRKFPGKDPLGHGIRIGPGIDRTSEPWATVVGVVGNVKQTSLAVSETDAVYTTPAQWYWVDNRMSLVIRARGDAAALAPAIRAAIWSVDKDQPIVRVAMMDQLVAASEAQRRFALFVFEAFALVALALAATGIYGVLSGSVTERMREIGLRAALGASRGNILALIVRQGMTLTGLGAAIGLAGAVAASQAIAAMLFGVSRLDPVTYLGVVALLAGVSMIACGVPAWRAVRIDPASMLRAE